MSAQGTGAVPVVSALCQLYRHTFISCVENAEDDDDGGSGRQSKKSKAAADGGSAVYDLDSSVTALIQQDSQNDKLWNDALTYLEHGHQVCRLTHLSCECCRHQTPVPMSDFLLYCQWCIGGYTRVYGVYQPPGFFDSVYSPQRS